MKCLSCGADVQLDPKTQKLKCDYCGNEFTMEDYNKKEAEAKKAVERVDYSAGDMETKMYTCTQCGGKLLAFEDTAVTFCSYCGSNIVIEPKLYKEEKPQYVIPFKITKEECEKNYKAAVNKFIFAPNEMKSDMVISKFRGIYMPYGVYKAEHHGNQVNNGSKYSHHSGNYDYYDDYTINTNVEAEFEGMSYDLSSEFQDKYSEAIAPFNFNEAQDFDVKYLSGYYADAKDVDKDVYSGDANAIVAPLATAEMKKKKEFAKFGCVSPKLGLNVTDVKTAYYPVYFLAIKNKNNTISYAAVNGQTGKVAVEMPIDFKKYIIFSLILAVPIFVLLLFLPVMKPIIVSIFGLVLSIITLIFSLSQKKALKEHELYLNDKGKNRSADKKITKEEKKKLTPTKVLKQIAGIIICGALVLLNPNEDFIAYGGAIIALVLVLISFKDLVTQYNALTSRKLAQLNARGGDENA